MTLPFSACAPRYGWCLRRDVEADLVRADQVLQDAVGDRALAARVRDTLLVVVFGADLNLSLPVPLDLPALLAPLLDQLGAPDGSTRTAADVLLEQLATLAELGRLRCGTHYSLTREGHLALRLDLCLAACRHDVRQTQLKTEALTQAAYLRQRHENAEGKGYVQHTSQRVYFSQVRQRAVMIDPVLAEQAGLDLGGFLDDEATS
jgi:hypothetical protein